MLPRVRSDDSYHFLVVVGGAPGSGKTTLARSLAKELRLPLLMRDELKEVLYDTLGAPDRQRSAELGPASYELVYTVARRILEAGVGLILESNFRRGISEGGLRPLVNCSKAVLVHCGGDPATIVHRFRERTERGERHAGHHDADVALVLRDQVDAGQFEPLDLGVPTLRVDTTTVDEYAPALRDIVAFLNRVREQPMPVRPDGV
jgi:predicted kinase